MTDADNTNTTTTQPTVYPREWKIALAAVGVTLLVAFAKPMAETASVWFSKADYSHGFLVPLFSGWLLWRRRGEMQPGESWPHPIGLVFFAAAAAGLVVGTLNIAKETCQGLAFICACIGIVTMFFGGLKSLRWAWPAILFLIFMFPLPYTFEQSLAMKLRRIATLAANYALQLFGQPSYIAGTGTVISVGETRLDVQHACSGLTMLLTFIALSAAYAAITVRPWTDRLLILLSSIPIAIFCNVLRIFVTGHVYIWGFNKLGDAIVHDLAGWLMMPVALGLIWFELKLVDWCTVTPIRMRKEDFLKANLVTDQFIRVRREGTTEPNPILMKPGSHGAST
ncbi:MAG: exosortase/archaeosortase family protein [Gemmataceae bacterium]